MSQADPWLNRAEPLSDLLAFGEVLARSQVIRTRGKPSDPAGRMWVGAGVWLGGARVSEMWRAGPIVLRLTRPLACLTTGCGGKFREYFS